MVRHKVEDLSDQQVNHIRRFAGLPPLAAKEIKSWRGFLRWQGYWTPPLDAIEMKSWDGFLRWQGYWTLPLDAKEMKSWRGFLRWHGYWIHPYTDEAAAEQPEEPPPALVPC